MTPDERKARLKEQYANDRAEYTKSINEYINRLADIKEFVNCETFFHSKRQDIVEKKHEYMDLTLTMMSAINRRKTAVLESILDNPQKNFSIKSKDERMILVDGDANILMLQESLDLLNNQIMFLNDTQKTIEGIIYNMKYRFEVQKYMGVC
jgi:hypothetical protein